MIGKFGFSNNSPRRKKHKSKGENRRIASACGTRLGVESLEDRRMLAAGDLHDLLVHDFSGSLKVDQLFASAIQADGKIVVGGYATIGDSRDFLIARYNPDGTLDSSFGGGDGIYTQHIAFDDEVRDLAIDSSGRIIAVGITNSSGVTAIGILRLTSAGLPDNSFDGDGVAVAILQNNVNVDISASASSVAIQGDGKIIVGGDAGGGANSNFAVIRFNADGSLDTSFNSKGYVITDIAGDEDHLTSIAVLANGSILAAGHAETISTASDIALVRYTATGSLDTEFGIGGKVRTDISGANSQDQANAMAILNDGRIVVAGWTATDNKRDFSVARYLVDGSLDSTFGAQGIRIVNVGTVGDIGRSMVVGPDGKYLVAGSTATSSSEAHRFGLIRLDTNGTLDTSFNGTGIVQTKPVGTDAAAITEVKIHPDGRIIGVGYVAPNNQLTNAALVRYDSGTVNVSAGGPYVVQAGESVTLAGFGGVAPGDFAWDFNNDGVYDDATGSNPVFPASALVGGLSAPVTLRVAMPGGGFSFAETTVTVQAPPPTVAAHHDSIAVSEGHTVTNSGTYTGTSVILTTGPGDLEDHGDGTWTWSHTTVDGDNTAEITITATNGIETKSVTFSITIENVPPVLEISGADTVAEGAPYTLALASSDVPFDTIQYWTIDWGDGNILTYQGNPASVTHTYADDSDYVISAMATDDDGTFTAGNTVAVAVSNVAPTLEISGVSSVDAGDLFTLELSASDPGTDTISQWTIDWGDGSEPEVVVGNPSAATHVYAVGGNTYTISATASDEDGTYDAVEHVVAVTNVTDEIIYLLGGTLHVAAGGLVADSEVTVGINGGVVEVTLNGETAAFDQANVEQIEIVLGSGNDIVTVGAGVTIPLVIDGGPGNDILAGGDGDDLLIGGAGTDILIGGAGDNVLLGGEGNDLLLGGAGNNVLSGGTGVDIIVGGSGRGLLIGGQGSDVLTGGSGDDILIGGSTIHDDDVDALDAIMAIWGSAQSFDSRVSALTGAGGLLQPNSAVSDDDALDVIVSGAGRDLIFGDNNPFDGVFDLISLQAAQDRLFAVT